MGRKPEPVSSAAVIRALHGLRERHGRPPSATDIAHFLAADEEEVLGHLRSLRRQRLFTDRRRGGRRVWIPWEEGNRTS